jgi:alkylation response protein AidB-like acyl-CoA dehydrogenase
VQLDNVRLGPEHLLGQAGEGLRMLEFLLAAERIDIAARAIGNATRAFEEARAYADVRQASGRAIRKFQAVSHKIADMRVTLDAGRLLVLRAARYYDHVLAESGPEVASRVCNEEASIAKLYCPEKSFWVCDQAMQIMGGHGYEQGTAVEAMFRDVRVLRFGGGTDEIQRHIVQRDDYQRFHDARGPG